MVTFESLSPTEIIRHLNTLKMFDLGGIGPGALDHKVLYTFATLNELFTNQGFVVNGLEYFNDSGDFIANHWKNEGGSIHRSFLNDERNRGGVNKYSSIIIDAFIPR